MIYQSLIQPLLFSLDTEKAHGSVISLAKYANERPALLQAVQALYQYKSPALKQQIWGLNFANPVGVAAGFDKNAQLLQLLEAIGFGHVEIGSVTNNPSPGNPSPRLFRLPKDHSLINRMGLNNDGAKTVIKRLVKHKTEIPVGVNIAKSNDQSIFGDKAIEDYLSSYKEADKAASYITVNVSCPNTEEGRTFEDTSALTDLLDALNLKNDARLTPTLVKFSVDLKREELMKRVEICEDFSVSGYVVSNTSAERRNLRTSSDNLKAIGRGGLSGRAIASKSTQMIHWLYQELQGKKPIFGVGGIDSADEALNKLRAGADVIQLYTGMVYRGPGIVKEINKGIDEYLKTHQMSSIHQLREFDKVKAL